MRLAAVMLAVWAPFMPFDGLQVVFLFALRSLGDQVAAGINGIVAFFVVTGGLGWLLVATGYGAWALIAAAGAGMVAAALLQGGRLMVVGRRLRRRGAGTIALNGSASPRSQVERLRAVRHVDLGAVEIDARLGRQRSDAGAAIVQP